MDERNKNSHKLKSQFCEPTRIFTATILSIMHYESNNNERKV